MNCGDTKAAIKAEEQRSRTSSAPTLEGISITNGAKDVRVRGLTAREAAIALYWARRGRYARGGSRAPALDHFPLGRRSRKIAALARPVWNRCARRGIWRREGAGDDHRVHSVTQLRPSATASSRCSVSRSRLHQMRWLFTSGASRAGANAAFKIGSATHCAVLEPERSAAQCAAAGGHRPPDEARAVGPWNPSPPSTRAGHLDAEEWQQICAMRPPCGKPAGAAQLLAQGTPELVARVETGAIPLQCRTGIGLRDFASKQLGGRPYVADPRQSIAFDVDAFPPFERACFQFAKYHRQAGFYLPLITEIIGAPVHGLLFSSSRWEKQAPLRRRRLPPDRRGRRHRAGRVVLPI